MLESVMRASPRASQKAKATPTGRPVVALASE